MEFGSTRLTIPASELLQINLVCVFHCRDKIITCHGLTIMSFEIKISAFPKIISAQKSINHTYYLRTLFINCHGVEVVYFHIRIWTYRVTHWTGVLRELMYTQAVGICDTLHCPGIKIGGKLLITKNSETFLETKLKPVTAGDTIPRPIVKIFVTDNPLDIVEICISSSFLRG